MNGRRLPTAIGVVSSGGLDPRQQIPLRPGLSGPSGRTDPARGKATYLGGRHDRRATSGGGDRGGRRGGHGSARARDHGRPALGLARGACPWRRDRVRGHVHPLSPELPARSPFPAPRSEGFCGHSNAAQRYTKSTVIYLAPNVLTFDPALFDRVTETFFIAPFCCLKSSNRTQKIALRFDQLSLIARDVEAQLDQLCWRFGSIAITACSGS